MEQCPGQEFGMTGGDQLESALRCFSSAPQEERQEEGPGGLAGVKASLRALPSFEAGKEKAAQIRKERNERKKAGQSALLSQTWVHGPALQSVPGQEKS